MVWCVLIVYINTSRVVPLSCWKNAYSYHILSSFPTSSDEDLINYNSFTWFIKTVWSQISWLQKPADLAPHCFKKWIFRVHMDKGKTCETVAKNTCWYGKYIPWLKADYTADSIWVPTCQTVPFIYHRKASSTCPIKLWFVCTFTRKQILHLWTWLPFFSVAT